MIIRVGTRQSKLAVRQTELVTGMLRQRRPDIEFIMVPVKTKGDKILDVPLAKIGDKGLFTGELEESLRRGEIDLAVHSMKDLPTQLAPGLMIGAVTRREDPRDVLVSRKNLAFQDLPEGARLGTGSLRRKAQLLWARPDLQIIELRGNLDTRLKKMESESLDAVVLAAAGLIRMSWQDKITERLDSEICLPAVGQGCLGLEARSDDTRILELIQEIHDPLSAGCVRAERALLQALDGGCQVPIGALAQTDDAGSMTLRAMVANLDGSEMLRDSLRGSLDKAESLGLELAEKLRSRGADAILSAIRCC